MTYTDLQKILAEYCKRSLVKEYGLGELDIYVSANLGDRLLLARRLADELPVAINIRVAPLPWWRHRFGNKHRLEMHGPKPPFHPNCRCVVSPVTEEGKTT